MSLKQLASQVNLLQKSSTKNFKTSPEPGAAYIKPALPQSADTGKMTFTSSLGPDDFGPRGRFLCPLKTLK